MDSIFIYSSFLTTTTYAKRSSTSHVGVATRIQTINVIAFFHHVFCSWAAMTAAADVAGPLVMALARATSVQAAA